MDVGLSTVSCERVLAPVVLNLSDSTTIVTSDVLQNSLMEQHPTKLMLCRCNLMGIPPMLMPATSLTSLHVDDNKLTFLEANLSNLCNLEELSFANNFVSSVETDLVLPQLRRVNCADNFLETLPLMFLTTTLQVLNCGNNRLRWLLASFV